MDDQAASAQPATVREEADGGVVRGQHARHRLPGHLLLPQAGHRSGQRVGRSARADEGNVREARHPRGRAQVPRRRHRAVRVSARVDPGLDHAWHAGHQGTRRGRQGVRSRRGDQDGRGRPCSRWREFRRQGDLRDHRRLAHDRRLGQPPVPTSCATFVATGSRKARYQPMWIAVEDLRVGDLVAVASDLPSFGTPASARPPPCAQRPRPWLHQQRSELVPRSLPG